MRWDLLKMRRPSERGRTGAVLTTDPMVDRFVITLPSFGAANRPRAIQSPSRGAEDRYRAAKTQKGHSMDGFFFLPICVQVRSHLTAHKVSGPIMLINVRTPTANSAESTGTLVGAPSWGPLWASSGPSSLASFSGPAGLSCVRRCWLSTSAGRRAHLSDRFG